MGKSIQLHYKQSNERKMDANVSKLGESKLGSNDKLKEIAF